MYDALVANVCFMIHRYLWLETEVSNCTTGERAADLRQPLFARARANKGSRMSLPRMKLAQRFDREID